VLTYREPQDRIWVWECEAVADSVLLKRGRQRKTEQSSHGDIVGDDGLLLKLKLLEEVRVENLADSCL
jgi:hypothetical protein